MKKIFCIVLLLLIAAAPAAATGDRDRYFDAQALTASATVTGTTLLAIDTLPAGSQINYLLHVESSTGGTVGLSYTLGPTAVAETYITPSGGGQLMTFKGAGDYSGTFTPGVGEKLKFVLTEMAGNTATVTLDINY